MWRIASILVILLPACTSVPMERDVFPDDPDFAPVSAQSLAPPPNANGSLYQARYSLGLYTDQQATRVGDIITVIFDEQYQSSKSAATNADKSSTNDLAVPSLMGTVPGFKNLNLDTSTSASRNFSGKGEADRSNSLSGQITVSVAEILPNGILRIRGEKWLTLSEGEEYIRIQGLVRPADITPDNTVASSKVADARISFGGRGALNNSTKQGWADRILTSPWWPF
ncbi:MAG: flagellar basal body L-ring protein FlgH [Thalassolituus sp.]|jgi:flagellar L-ring protein precursor FlgH|uniref:flagellar basal body L-ring protein FlgH n=1 Tax=Thalassolituus TaxID=187492 RepID=UPI00042DDB3F|nr:flagellar basal body L-ring protein FlgH [Thalassolituus oleivorans]PCI50730.1 MAG: flagellar basal body L-ring protein FlgH [Oceanospirillales bacterium]AHK15274.1 flagellar basal body L-ring protein [Thalassolituus oleivorans R6-15]APR66422.1 flagellar basal body L-ring protein [Thalassolituus oleivorans]MBQ0727016.1 flagellar basal body L-ring protein FlgH [Thalassolituus oleivorans]MCA6129157.1 flagellar basal body L-ring protein [Thalassolituus oleivorans 4BN06-13]